VLRLAEVEAALTGAAPGDLLLMQNETNLQAEAAELGKARGLRVIYSAAPFAAASVTAVLGSASILVMNRGEAAELERALGRKLGDLPVQGVLVTLGGDGAVFHDIAAGETVEMPAFRVAVADTTGAGDTFAGYFAAGLDQGMPIGPALRLASAAAALKVTRAGTADAIPDRAEVDGFLEAR
jgi:ribokinase